MQHTSTLPHRQHLDYLDSARGIAALMVLFYHFINWRYEKLTSMKFASMIANGSDAVSFFFVLSGFVLSYKYIVMKQPLDVRNFLITRFLRLFPGFFVALFLNAMYWQRHDLHLHNLVEVFVRNRDQFWEEAYLLKAHTKYYVPGWTLVIELTVSFFMPFAIVIAKTNKKLLLWLLLTYLLTSYVISPFFVHFTLGLFISCYFLELSDGSFRQTKWFKYRYPLLVLAFIMLSVRHIDRLSAFGPTYKYLAGYFQIDFFLYTGIGSFIFLVALVQSSRLQALLTNGILRFYGKISYGVYLMHWLLVTYVFEHWDKLLLYFNNNTKVAFFSLLLACVILTTVMATALHYTVELPFIRLAKKITGRLRPSVVIV